MRSSGDLRKGHLVAEILTGAWRDSPPAVQISESDLDEVTPLLYASGAVALGWRRLSTSELRNCPSAEVLHQAYRLMVLQSEIHEQQLEKLFRLLREASVDAVLAKGWVAAGLYPDRALRPFGDFDICVPAVQFKLVQDVLSSRDAQDCWVDLHKEFQELDDRSTEEIFARSRRITLGSEQIRVLGVEDHLALLCIHLLKHGAWRPLWLCDIAAAVESLPQDFDWSICLGRNSRSEQWITCAIGLTRQLLSARIDHLPKYITSKEVPPWVTQSVLYQWSILHSGEHRPMHSLPLMVTNLKQGRDILKAVLGRWPDPITATFNRRGRFNNFPRVPYQLLDFLVLNTKYLTQLPAKLRAGHQ